MGVGSSTDVVKILEGVISGMKVSQNMWNVDVSILIPNVNKTLSVKQIFILQ
jgi:hypothetical protein